MLLCCMCSVCSRTFCHCLLMSVCLPAASSHPSNLYTPNTFAFSILYYCETHSIHTYKKNGIITVHLKLILNSMHVPILCTIWNMSDTLTLYDSEHHIYPSGQNVWKIFRKKVWKTFFL